MHKYNPNIHHRRSIRLKGFDYAQAGLYFLTLCTQNRKYLFGDISDGKMILNDAGKHTQKCWLEIPQHFPNIKLHQHIIMPNHIHGIIEIVGANQYSPNNPSPDNPSPNNPSSNNQSPNNPSVDNQSVDNQSVDNQSPNNPSPNNQSVDNQSVDPTRAKNISPDNQSVDPTRAKNISPNNQSPNNPSPSNQSPDNQSVDNLSVDPTRAKNISHVPTRANIDSPLRSPSQTIGSVVRGFKIGVTKWFRENLNNQFPVGQPVWQRNYWEHIIRNEKSYQNISDYIANNPIKWSKDKFYKT